MDYARIFELAEQARRRQRFTTGDVAFLRDAAPAELGPFAELSLPKSVRHPGGFTVSGAPVGTFLRGALLLAGQKAAGRRASGFYERVEADLALRIMRSNFHNGYPKGAYCCAQCTLAMLPVYDAKAIRYFGCRPLADNVRRLIEARAWRFARPPHAKMLRWAGQN